MTKKAIIDTDDVSLLQLLSKDEAESEFGEAIASALDVEQVVTWAKFVLTDDRPNENGQRIPQEEFDNIIKTGMYKPVKMAVGEINDGHDESKPLGVITNLIKSGRKIIALAALWDHERVSDVALIRDRVQKGKPVNVSWEIMYGAHVINDGIEDLLDTVLTAATIVGRPAYAGRTQFLAVAAKKWSKPYVADLPNSHFLFVNRDGQRYFPYRDSDGVIDKGRLENILKEAAETSLPENTLKTVRHQVKKMLQAFSSATDTGGGDDRNSLEDYKLETDVKLLNDKVSDLEAKLAEAAQQLSDKEAKIAEIVSKCETLEASLASANEELVPLRDFKADAENKAARAAKLDAIRGKFVEKGIEKDETYFAENAENLLGLGEPELEFMLQELAAFKETSASSRKDREGNDLPNIPGENGSPTMAEIVAALRARQQK